MLVKRAFETTVLMSLAVSSATSYDPVTCLIEQLQLSSVRGTATDELQAREEGGALTVGGACP